MRILPGARGADLKPAFEYIGQIPVLADTAADIVASRASGDHSMFIGHIVDLGAGTPLVVHGERGAALIYLEEAAEGPVTNFW